MPPGPPAVEKFWQPRSGFPGAARRAGADAAGSAGPLLPAGRVVTESVRACCYYSSLQVQNVIALVTLAGQLCGGYSGSTSGNFWIPCIEACFRGFRPLKPTLSAGVLRARPAIVVTPERVSPSPERTPSWARRGHEESPEEDRFLESLHMRVTVVDQFDLVSVRIHAVLLRLLDAVSFTPRMSSVAALLAPPHAAGPLAQARTSAPAAPLGALPSRRLRARPPAAKSGRSAALSARRLV